jgi:hypothetical protein
MEEGVDAVLICPDAKKAFDTSALRQMINYGFGPKIINCFKTLQSKISTKLLIK